MPGAGFASPSIWQSGWRKPQHRCGQRLSPTRLCWPPSRCPCPRDPADRFLAATAQVMDLTLVTSDDLLLGLGTFRTMKN